MVSLSASSKEKRARKCLQLQKFVRDHRTDNARKLGASIWKMISLGQELKYLASKERILKDLIPFSLKEILRKMNSIDMKINLDAQTFFPKKNLAFYLYISTKEGF